MSLNQSATKQRNARRVKSGSTASHELLFVLGIVPVLLLPNVLKSSPKPAADFSGKIGIIAPVIPKSRKPLYLQGNSLFDFFPGEVCLPFWPFLAIFGTRRFPLSTVKGDNPGDWRALCFVRGDLSFRVFSFLSSQQGSAFHASRNSQP